MSAAITSIITSFLKSLPIWLVALVAFYVYEEGIPGASRVAFPASWPLIGGIGIVDVPVIGDLTTGRVHTFAADQVRLATAAQTAICDARIEKLSSSAELAAAQAELAEVKRQHDAAAQAYTEYQRRASADQQTLQVENEKLESIIAEHSKRPDGNWSAAQLQWLCDHGSKAGYCSRNAGADKGGH